MHIKEFYFCCLGSGGFKEEADVVKYKQSRIFL